MAGQTRLIYNSAFRHVATYKSAVIRDIIFFVLLVKLTAIAAVNITTNYNLILFVVYCLSWSILFSRHSFRIMPSSNKTGLFLFGLFFLIITLLSLVLSGIAIDAISSYFFASNILKMVVSGLVISIALVYGHPTFLKFVVPRKQMAIRSGINKRPYYIFPVYFFVFFGMILLFRFIVYGFNDNVNITENFFLDVAFDIVLFFSAVMVSSLIFAVYKKGIPVDHRS